MMFPCSQLISNICQGGGATPADPPEHGQESLSTEGDTQNVFESAFCCENINIFRPEYYF